MKLQETKNGQYFCCLPRELVRAKEWAKGTDLKVTINEKGDLLIKKL